MKFLRSQLNYLGLAILAVMMITIAGATDGRCDGEGAYQMSPPPDPYKKVSTLVPLPEFIPGLGSLYVDPATLLAGPFLAYNRDGKLVSSVYMIPLKNINDQKEFKNLKVAKEKVDHVDMYYNAGHPGVAEPHYHIVLWYISPEAAAALK